MNHSQTGVVDLRRRDDDSDEGVERRQELVKDDHRVHREGRRVEVSLFPRESIFLALSIDHRHHHIQLDIVQLCETQMIRLSL